MNINLPLDARRGISLIEGVLYLVIALAVIVGGIVFFQQAQLSNNVTATARTAVGISSQTRALYHDQQSFGDGDDLTAAVVQAGMVPSNFVSDDGGTPAIDHPFGGSVTVTGAGSGFVISYADMTRAACQRLASVSPRGEGPMGVGIFGMTIAETVDPATSPDMTGAIRAEDVSGACAEDIDIAVYYARVSGTEGDAGSGSGGSGDPDYDFGDLSGMRLSIACGRRPLGGAPIDIWEEYYACEDAWEEANYG